MAVLFTPDPRRKRGLILTLIGSLLFHGSLIGLAAFWPLRTTPEIKPIISVGWETPEPPGELQLPTSAPGEPEPDPTVLAKPEPVDDPVPLIEPNADDMTLATPPDHRSGPTTRVNSLLTATRHSTAPTGFHSAAQANGTVGDPRAGASKPSARWVTPKPVYPAPLRLAHVQGTGSVRVTTDAGGHVISAMIVQSTGNARLDDLTCQAAKNGWSGPANSTVVVPVTYELQ